MASTQLGRVLILENDCCNRILFAEYLEYCGYRVRPICNAQHIFASLEEFQPHVLMLNLRMPVIDGYTIIERLRSHAQWQHLAILVVSGYTQAWERHKAYRLGADAYLTKPVLPSDMSAAIERLIAGLEKGIGRNACPDSWKRQTYSVNLD